MMLTSFLKVFYPGNILVSRIVVVVSLVLIISSGLSCKNEPDKVVFMAGFKAQANLPFVAAYVAEDKGYFEDQGLEVDIKHASRI